MTLDDIAKQALLKEYKEACELLCKEGSRLVFTLPTEEELRAQVKKKKKEIITFHNFPE